MRPTNEPPEPGLAVAGIGDPAEAFSPVIDPGLVPGPSADDDQARENRDDEDA